MGQMLSEPITAKQTSSVQNKLFKVGSSSMQGWRISMEDAHTHILQMTDDKNAAFSESMMDMVEAKLLRMCLGICTST